MIKIPAPFIRAHNRYMAMTYRTVFRFAIAFAAFTFVVCGGLLWHEGLPVDLCWYVASVFALAVFASTWVHLGLPILVRGGERRIHRWFATHGPNKGKVVE